MDIRLSATGSLLPPTVAKKLTSLEATSFVVECTARFG